MILASLACLNISGANIAPNLDYAAAAESLASRIDSAYSTVNGYREEVSWAGKPSESPAFAWDMGVWLSALAKGCGSSREARALFGKAFGRLEVYGSKLGGGFAYAVLPRQDSPDRYFDDNEWIAIALVEAFSPTRDHVLLDRAEAVLDWIMTGEDPKFGGGVYWHEGSTVEKNVCSNAPAVVLAMKLYRQTRKGKYLEFARREMEWLKLLQDDDALFFDHLGAGGKVDKTKWSYNSALMIRANLEFFRATVDRSYLTEAERIAAGSVAKWLDGSTGALKDESAFAHHLADAWIELARDSGDESWRLKANRAIEYAYAKSCGPDGRFGLRWDQPPTALQPFKLLYQASMLRALWSAAQP